jgi:acyl-CoA reductase-like NAD-dependent aldehyde dehydrogenase
MVSRDERGSVLYKFADMVLQQSDELASLENFGNGKTLDIA